MVVVDNHIAYNINMNLDFEQKFKDVIEFVKNSKMESPNKPAIPHVLRVGEMLYEKGFDKEIVKAGLLHDMLEWSSVSEKELEKKFGKRILEIVKANSKDRSIEDKKARRELQIAKNLELGDNALAVKIADNIDSFRHYSITKNEKNLQRCRDWNDLLRMHLSDDLKKIFSEDLKRMI